MEVLRPGLLTTIQDLGRQGFRKYGVVSSGAMDVVSHTIANWLVGNPSSTASMEVTLTGPTFKFAHDAIVAICGAPFRPMVNGHSVPMWRPLWIRKGAQLSIGAAMAGCRAYIAAAGGIDVPLQMNSRSTYVKAGLGGLQGRPLRVGDNIPVSAMARPSSADAWNATEDESCCWPKWHVSPEVWKDISESSVFAMPGSHYDDLGLEAQNVLWNEPFVVTPQADRMGIRLSGRPLLMAKKTELISEGVLPGTVQLPPGGQPIILMADAQTTGGYPRILHVAQAHLPRIAQLRAGDTLQFTQVTVEAAQTALRKQYQYMRTLAHVLAWRVRKEVV